MPGEKSISTDLPYIDHYSLWLVFDEESTAQCQPIIQKLAKVYQSVEFTPHITLSGLSDWSLKKINNTIADIAGGISPLTLETTSVRCSSNPYQKLTQGIQTTVQLHNLHLKTDTSFEGDFANKVYPHISYLYSRLECSDVLQEIEQVEKEAPRKVLVNKLALVQCEGTPEEWSILSIWELNN